MSNDWQLDDAYLPPRDEPTQPRPHPAFRYRLEGGAMVAHPEGQWVHVKDCGFRTWALDPLLPARKGRRR